MTPQSNTETNQWEGRKAQLLNPFEAFEED